MEAEADIEEELKSYPSLFRTIKDFSSLSQKYLTLRLKKIEEEIEEQGTRMEKCRIYNLISFICYLLGNTEDALKNNDESLNIYPDNVIGLCNRGWFLFKWDKKFSETKQLCEKLDGTQEDRSRIVIAKAEIAYAYTRLGIKFYSKAYELFNEVICEAKSIDFQTVPDPNEFEDNICEWSYRCALPQTRLFRTYNVCYESDLELSKDKVVSVCHLLKNIIQSNTQYPSCRLLKPKAYVLLGGIASSIESTGTLHFGLIQEVLHEEPELTVDGYYEKALKLQDNDSFVLDRCGMHYKQKNDLDRAIELFKRSIAIKESSLNHHHLAVALKDKLQSIPGHDHVDVVSRQLFEKGGEVFVDSGRQHNDHGGLRREVTAFTNLNIEHKKKKMINSPKKIPKIDRFQNEEAIQEILYHLEESLTLAMNTESVYDKGLLYRQTGQLEEAIQEFRLLTKNEHRQVSLVVLANSYEQIGYCLQGSIDAHLSQDPDSDKEDMRMYFKKSLEISCKVVAKIPQLKNCWNTAPTLQSLLEGNATTKKTLKDLNFLYEKMKEYDKNIDILKQLLFTAKTNKEQIECGLKIIQNHLEMKCFDDCVLSFEFIRCLPEWQELVYTELFVKVYIEGAYDSYKRYDKEVASLRFDNAFDFCRSKWAIGQSNTKEIEFSVLVLCNPNYEDNGEKLLAVLEHLGIKATLNNGHEGYGRLKSELLNENVEQSNHVLVIYDFIQSDPVENKELLRYVDIMSKILSERGHGNAMTIVSNETIPSTVPKTLPTQQVIYDFSDAENETGLNVDSVKDILIKLAIGVHT
ncbi:Interferon-induced protein [Mactra antiquata]